MVNAHDAGALETDVSFYSIKTKGSEPIRSNRLVGPASDPPEVATHETTNDGCRMCRESLNMISSR